MSSPMQPERAAALRETCLVLMFKSPERSKRRLAAEIGPLAATAAELLLDCAAEDLAEWPGTVCVAPAERGDEAALEQRLGAHQIVVAQRGGNLGQRINTVNAELVSRGVARQIFIGIDCPALDARYLARAARALDVHDAVLGPAADGGAVLIASRRPLPNLGGLAWSSRRLLEELETSCREHGFTTTRLPQLTDVDSVADLRALGPALGRDRRRARIALRHWVDDNAERLEQRGRA